MRRALPRLLLAVALLFLTACDKKSILLITGTPSTLDVRVYVDANGNGSYDAGDEAIASATLTLTGDASEQTASTGSDGLARFESVLPGSYDLTASGGVPSGAVLATATTVTVVAKYQGGQLSAEFRYAFEPGSVSGRLFRDDNENGTYDEGADLVAAGIPVDLFSGSSATGDPAATTSTDKDGLFEFETLRPGTYTLKIHLLETMELVGGATRTLDVAPDVEADVDLLFTGTLLIDIATARDAPDGQVVTVEGVITWAPSFDSRALWLQDATAGITVFDYNLPDGLEIGTRVQMTGIRGSYSGELQISPVIDIEILGAGPTPVARPVTAADINAGNYQGELVAIDGMVEQIDVLSYGNQMVLLRDGEDNTFAVKVDSRTGVEADTWTVGMLFGVTGVLGADDDESGTDIEDNHPYRVEPRSPDDVQRGGATTPIGDARNAIGSTVVIQGIVTWVPSFDSRTLFLQDETGGINLFDYDLEDFEPAGGFQEGDLVRLSGTIGAYRGETQISDIEDLEVVANVAVPATTGAMASEMNDGHFQGVLVSITGTVSNVDVLSYGNQMVTLSDAGGTEFFVYADSRTGVTADAWTVGQTYRVSGVVGADDRNDPAARIEVRALSDVVLTSPGTVSIAEARGMFGETVTVEGVVTRIPSWDNKVAFVQDGSAGIGLFSYSLPAVAPGDRVRITGDVGAYRGELQIGPDDVTILEQVAVPDPIDVTAAQVNAGLFQGQFVRTMGTVVSVEIINQYGTQEVTVQDALGDSFILIADNRTGLTEADWTVGGAVTVLGILGFYDGNDPGAQLEVMNSNDVTFGP
jgi:DNA/RNA endonuclease YhcR with UshA esterase domain